MKNRIIIFTVFVLIFSYSCSLDGGLIIGPSGGYVFYDKGNYDDDWRYLETPPKEESEKFKLSGSIGETINFSEILTRLNDFSYGGNKGWRLPTYEEFVVMAQHNGTYLNSLLDIDEKTFYVVSENRVYSGKSEKYINSSGDEATRLIFIQGSGRFEDDCKYFYHPVRGF